MSDSGVTVTDRSAELFRALRQLADTSVMVGIPSDDEQPHLGAGPVGPDQRTGGSDEISNAALGYVMENGLPEHNVPARPFLVPGVEEARGDIEQRLHDAADAAMAGNATAVDKNLMAAGLVAQAAVRNRIRSNIPPPLQPATIRARRRRTKGSSYRRKATTAADVVALIDSSQMLNAISFVLRRRR